MPKKKSESWKSIAEMPVGEWVRIQLNSTDAHGAPVCAEAVSTGTAILWAGGVVDPSTIKGWNKIKIKAKKEKEVGDE